MSKVPFIEAGYGVRSSRPIKHIRGILLTYLLVIAFMVTAFVIAVLMVDEAAPAMDPVSKPNAMPAMILVKIPVAVREGPAVSDSAGQTAESFMAAEGGFAPLMQPTLTEVQNPVAAPGEVEAVSHGNSGKQGTKGNQSKGNAGSGSPGSGNQVTPAPK